MILNPTPVPSSLRLQKTAASCLCVLLLLVSTSQIFAQVLPRPAHIVILIEENQANTEVIGNLQYAPFINQIAADSEANVFANMFALQHPSQPNYLDLFSGDNQGVQDDGLPLNYPFTTPNMARELLDAGLTFVTYSQDLPAVGSDVVSSGSYVRKHNPVTNWVGTGQNQVPDTLNQPYTAFPTDFSQLPTVSYVVPNEDSDMHNLYGNPAIANGDFWFKEHLDSFITWCAKPENNTLFIYTFDEDDGGSANNIPTVFYGPMVQHGHDATSYTLYSILRTIEDMYGLGYAGAAQTTVPILDCWKTATAVNTVPAISAVKCYPNPAASTLQFEGDILTSTGTLIEITDVTGSQLETISATGARKVSVNTAAYANGMYFYNLISAAHTVQSGKFVVAH